jgi:hypothetical protein
MKLYQYTIVRYLQTSALSLSRMNNVALVAEIEIGADGSYKDKM